MLAKTLRKKDFVRIQGSNAPTLIDDSRYIKRLISDLTRAANQPVVEPIQAVILAAGRGSRLARAIDNGPKCLARVGERTLIDHQLEIFSEAGIEKVCVVTGYRAEEVREVVGDRAEIIHNDAWEKTNSLYSLELCRDWVNGPLLVMNCDVLLPREALHRVLACPGNAFAYDSSSGMDEEHTKVSIADDSSLMAMSKSLPCQRCHGENVGLLYFDRRAARLLFREAQALLAKGNEHMWVIAAVHEVCNYLPMHAIDVADLPWIEIDFPEDLEKARKHTWPAIQEQHGLPGDEGRLESKSDYTSTQVSKSVMGLVDEVVEQLWQTLQQGNVSRERIREFAVDVATGFKDARITTYIPILLERATRDRIRAETPCTSDGI